MNAAEYITLSWIKKAGVRLFETIEPLFYRNPPKISLQIRQNGADPVEIWPPGVKIREHLMRLWRDHRQPRRYLRKKYSLETFFSELNRLDVRYVVLRWFETLPEIAPGEDVDILIHDDDLPKLDMYLAPYHIASAIKFDIYSVSGLPGSEYRNALLYFPKKLSEQLLANRILWKGNCFVPSSMEHFLSMAYHVVYHKAEHSGLQGDVRSRQLEGKFHDHNYSAVLNDLAYKNNISVELTLKGLHAFLKSRGFAPNVDLTRKLGVGHSKWLMKLYPQQTFFSTNLPEIPSQKEYSPLHRESLILHNAQCDFPHITVFLIREWAMQHNLSDFIVKTLERHGFEIAFVLKLDDCQKARAATELRGGNWSRGPYPVGGGLPSQLLVAVDQHPVKPTGELAQKQPFLTNERVDFVKKILRDFVNRHLPIHQQSNFLHSCDDAREVEEYIGVICPELRDQIYSKIQQSVDDYQTRAVVLKDLSKENRRAKVELIEWRGQKAVKKTYKTGRERFLQREIFAYRELSKQNNLIPPLLDAGKNYVTLPYFEEMKDATVRKKYIQNNLNKIEHFLKFLFDEGYAHLDFKPDNLLFTVGGALKIIDFEYLQPYQQKPVIFRKSYDFTGAPADFSGDLPVGGHRFIERQWQNIFGKRVNQLIR